MKMNFIRQYMNIKKENVDLEKQVSKFVKYILIIITFINVSVVVGQSDSLSNAFDYRTPKTYVLEDIVFSGLGKLDKDVISMITGLSIGDTISVPGDAITKALKNLWKQRLFNSIDIKPKTIKGDKISLHIILKERPRLSKFSFKGIKRGDIDNIKDKLDLIRGKIVTESLKLRIVNVVKSHFIEKGFYSTSVKVDSEKDETLKNGVSLKIKVNKGPRVKISAIVFEGNQNVNEKKLKRLFKETKEKQWSRVFKSSKYIEDDFNADKKIMLDHYLNKGYRDINIIKDSVWLNADSLLEVYVKVHEGKKYYFGNITWSGNTRYPDSSLISVLGIYKGDVFNQSELEQQLFANPNGRDISSLYMDHGYLFFQVNPIERRVYGDTIDLEINIYEGPQAVINKIKISGNTKTNEHVIRRELRTLPGDKFSRSDIIRSQREIANLGYFNPENMNVNPIPQPENGTVDIEYKVEEKPSDQVELSAGWGQNTIVGTLGVSFNNFSVKNIFKKGSWVPLPSGDGQRLSIRAQSTGRWYKSLSASFTEPWLGGKKPNSMTVAIYSSLQSDNLSSDDPEKKRMQTNGAAVNFGFRLKVPDDFFVFQTGIEFQQFSLTNWTGFGSFLFPDGIANNVNVQAVLSRNSIDNPLYPRDGSKISLTIKATPPYSALSNKDYSTLSLEDKYEWIEYHKWKFDAEWYSSIIGDLVLKARASFGFLGLYNRDIGISPFERFELGGDGITNFQLYGKEIVALRGYESTDVMTSYTGGAPIFDKFTLEMRYPLSLNPMSTIYALAFMEGGNVWSGFKEYNPFDIKRTLGVGVRIFLPMFGLLGFDYGIGFDKELVNSTNVFDKGKFSILLGFEPY
ncbi:MAG TPA: outer membrane protein assembly factor BamA [Bacteroidetes bacterium]|nr:outer membrane protein assembly factor BamA [Bacteroidota bacterium]